MSPAAVSDIATTRVDRCPHCHGADLAWWTEAPDFLLASSAQRYTYLRCRTCGVLFLATRPEELSLGRIYSDQYSPYAPATRTSGPARSPSLVGRVLMRLVTAPETRFHARLEGYYARLPSGSLFLDFGCGAGKMLDRMRARGCMTVGMDFSERALGEVRSKGHVALPVVAAGWDALAESSVDFVRMNHVLEHLYRPDDVLQRLRMKMRPGARLHIAVPNPAGLSARLFKRHWHGLDCPRHVVLFPPTVLAAWLDHLGFRKRHLLYEPLYKDFIRSQARAWRRHEGADGVALDEIMTAPLRRLLAALPVLVATCAGFPDRFHVIAER
jgi:SAM-dependent methyltransferase